MDDKEDAEERIENTVEVADDGSRAGRSSACRVAVGATPERDEHVAITHGPTHASAVRSPRAGRVAGWRRGPSGDPTPETRKDRHSTDAPTIGSTVRPRSVGPSLLASVAGCKGRLFHAAYAGALCRLHCPRSAGRRSGGPSRKRVPAPRCADPSSRLRRVAILAATRRAGTTFRPSHRRAPCQYSRYWRRRTPRPERKS